MKIEYKQPIIEVLVISDEKIMLSGEHDNSYGDFGDWDYFNNIVNEKKL